MEQEEQQPKLVLPHHLHQDSTRLNLVQTRHHQGRLGGTISGPWLGVGKRLWWAERSAAARNSRFCRILVHELISPGIVGSIRLNREIEECAEWQASNEVLSMHGFDACHAAQFSQTGKGISDVVPHKEHQTCPQSTTSAIRVLRSALAICHHGATSQAVNLSRRFDLHDFVDLCRHERLRKVHSIVIHCLVKMVMRTSSRNEQIRQSMIIAHEVPGFGRESTVHDFTPLKSRCFRLLKQTVPTQARGTPHLLDNRLTRVLQSIRERHQARGLECDATSISISHEVTALHCTQCTEVTTSQVVAFSQEDHVSISRSQLEW